MVQLYNVCEFKFYISKFNFLKSLYCKFETIMNGTYDNNPDIESLNITIL